MLLANELLGRGMRESNRATARRVSKAERDAGVSAAAVVLLDAAEPGPDITLHAVLVFSNQESTTDALNAYWYE